jgi:hypothetical protein
VVILYRVPAHGTSVALKAVTSVVPLRDRHHQTQCASADALEAGK